MTGTWRTGAPMMAPRSHFIYGAVGETLFCIAGRDGDQACVSLNEAFDTRTETWQIRAPKPTACFHCGQTTVGHRIYCMGGFEQKDDRNVATDRVEIYDALEDTWHTGAPLPQALAYNACTYYDGKIYSIGGYSTNGVYAVRHDCLYIYDVAADTWTAGQSLPIELYAQGVAGFEGNIYSFGGTAFQNHEHVYVYDISTDAWSRAPDMPHKRSVFGFVQMDHSVLICGGNSLEAGYRDTVLCYDLPTDTWTEVTAMPTPRNRLGSCVVGNRLYCFGGVAEGTSATDRMEIFEWNTTQTSIVLRFEDQENRSLQPPAAEDAAVGLPYTATAPAIPSYTCIGHQVDGGSLKPGTTASIDVVLPSGHTITFLYRNNDDDGKDPEGGFKCCCRPYVHIHDNTIPVTIENLHIHTCSGCNSGCK